MVLPDDKVEACAACCGWPSQDLSKHQEQAQVPSRREPAYPRDEGEEDAREESFGEVDPSSIEAAHEGEVSRSREDMEGEPGLSAKAV